MKQQATIPLTLTENHSKQLIPPANGKPTTRHNSRSNESPPAATDNQTASLSDMVHEALGALRQEVADGLLYTHSRANSNTSRLLEATSFLYALIELLAENGPGHLPLPCLQASPVSLPRLRLPDKRICWIWRTG